MKNQEKPGIFKEDGDAKIDIPEGLTEDEELDALSEIISLLKEMNVNNVKSLSDEQVEEFVEKLDERFPSGELVEKD